MVVSFSNVSASALFVLVATFLAGCGDHTYLRMADARAERLADGRVKVDVTVTCHEADSSCPDKWCVTAEWYDLPAPTPGRPDPSCENGARAGAGRPIGSANQVCSSYLEDGGSRTLTLTSSELIPQASSTCVKVSQDREERNLPSP